jgi:tetratricopeptide (TPR) repeat protein
MRGNWMIISALTGVVCLSGCAAPPSNQLASGCPASGPYQPALSQRKALDCEGKYYVGRREYQKAIDNFTLSIQVDPAHAETYYRRSLAYRALGETGQADADLAKAKQMDPTLPGV